MKAIIVSVLLILIGLVLPACSVQIPGIGDRLDDEYASVPEERMEQMVTLIDGHETERIWELFSVKAKDENVSIDSVDQMVTLLEGNISSFEPVSGVVDKRVQGEDRYYKYSRAFSISGLNDKKYIFLLEECLESSDSNEIGISRIMISPEDSEERYDVPETGIYLFE